MKDSLFFRMCFINYRHERLKVLLDKIHSVKQRNATITCVILQVGAFAGNSSIGTGRKRNPEVVKTSKELRNISGSSPDNHSISLFVLT